MDCFEKRMMILALLIVLVTYPPLATTVCQMEESIEVRSKYSFCCCRKMRYNQTSREYDVQINTTYTTTTQQWVSYPNITRYNSTFWHHGTVWLSRYETRTEVNSSDYMAITLTDSLGSTYDSAKMSCFTPSTSETRKCTNVINFMTCDFCGVSSRIHQGVIVTSEVLLNISADQVSPCNSTLTYECSTNSDSISCTFCTNGNNCKTLTAAHCTWPASSPFKSTLCGEMKVLNVNSTNEILFLDECHCSNDYDALKQQRELKNYGFVCPLTKFYIGGFFDLSTKNGLSTMPAAEMAIEYINSDPNYFLGYEMVLSNGKNQNVANFHHTCSEWLLNYIFHSVHHKLMFIGPSNSNDLAKTIAVVAGLERIDRIQFSFGTDNLDLVTDRLAYPNFYRTNPTLFDYNRVRMEIIKLFKWKRVGLLFSTENSYYELNANMRSLLQANSVEVAADESFSNDPTSAIESLVNKGIHVIIGTYHWVHSSKVYCEMYLRQLVSPWYVMLSMDGFTSKPTSKCLAAEVECARRDQFYLRTESDRTSTAFFGKSSYDIEVEYKIRTPYQFWDYWPAMYAYDTVNVIAHVIKKAFPTLKTWKKNLDQIKYGDTAVAALFRDILSDTDLNGTTGRIRFSSNGNRYNDISVYQQHSGSARMVGSYFGWKGSFLLLPTVNWLSGEPHREITVKEKWKYICFGLYITLCVLALLTLIFAICLLVWILLKRRHLLLENSFWLLNVVSVIGCMLLLTSVFTFGVDSSVISNFGVACVLRKWLFSIGFILLVAPLFAKLQYGNKVFLKRQVLFNNRTRRRMWIVIFVLLFVTILVLLLWTILDPMKREIKLLEDTKEITCYTTVISFNPYLREITYIETCGCSKQVNGWLGVISVYFLLLLIISIIYARQTRKLFLYTLNDTWYCGLCVYVITACYLLGLLFAWLLCDSPCWFFGLLATLIIVCVVLVLLILFLHKFIFLSSACCCCCSKDSKSETEDRIMYESYVHETLSYQSNSSYWTRSNSVDPSSVSFNSRLSTPPKKERNCCKRCFGGMFSCCDWCWNGTPEFQQGGWRPNGEQMFVLRGNDKNNYFRMSRIVPTKPVSTQTNAIQKKPRILVNSQAVDAGDGLNSSSISRVKRNGWSNVRETLLKHGYMKNFEHFRSSYNAPSLKIFHQKLDWSHVVSSLQKQGITNKRTAEIATKNAELRRKTIAAAPRYLNYKNGTHHKNALANAQGSKKRFERIVGEGGRKTTVAGKSPVSNRTESKNTPLITPRRIINGPGSLTPEQPFQVRRNSAT